MEDTQGEAQALPSRGQTRLLAKIVGGYYLFADGFHYSLMYPWCGNRELVTQRMVNSLRRAGWIANDNLITRDGYAALKKAEQQAREKRMSRARSTS